MRVKLKGRIAVESLKALGSEHVVSSQHNKIPRIWIIAADSDGARVFRKNDGHLELLGECVPNKRMSFAGFGENTVHHGYRPDNDPKDCEKAAFAHKLAAWLDVAAHDDAFDRLVVAAPPRMLGELRKAMSKQVSARVVAEVSKDLAKCSETALRAALAEILWF